MSQLGRLLGEKDSVHFHKLKESSTAILLGVEWEAIPKIHDRIQDVKVAEAANDAMYALNEMLREDNAVGEFRTPGQHEPLLRFPGREILKPERIGPFNEPVIFKGELVRIEGAEAIKHAGIKDAQGRIWSGAMSRELAIQMREWLFEWVMVEGPARWIRNEDSTWEMKTFQIKSCKLLRKGSLDDDIAYLRNINENEWKKMEDPLGFIRDLRDGDDEIQ